MTTTNQQYTHLQACVGPGMTFTGPFCGRTEMYVIPRGRCAQDVQMPCRQDIEIEVERFEAAAQEVTEVRGICTGP